MNWITSLFKSRVSLRDQFAMSAPLVPAWFAPIESENIPVFPDIYMLFGKLSGHPLRHLMKYYNEEEETFHGYPGDDLESIITLEQEINGTMDRFKAIKESNRLDYMIKSTERITRWRYFYADAMLKRSGDNCDYFIYYENEKHLYELLAKNENMDSKVESETV